MFLPVIFFIFAALFGLLVVYLLKIKIFLEEKIVWAVILGQALLVSVIFVFSLLFGFSRPVILLPSSALFVLAAAFCFFSKQRILKEVKEDVWVLKKRLKNGKLTAFLILFVLASVFFAFLWPKVLFQNKAGDILTMGINGVWGDWSAHLSYISHFLYSDKISLENPIFLGAKFSYTFMVDFLSAVLMKIGADLYWATLFPGFVFSLCLVLILYFFALRLTRKENASLLSVVLFLFGSGFGFVYFLKEIKGMDFSGITDFLGSSFQQYTFFESHNIFWPNFITILLLPQRALAMGMPLGILILTLVLIGLERKNNKMLFFAGALCVVLPLIHLHTLLSVAAIGFFLITFASEEKGFRPTIKKLFLFFLPIFFLALPQVFLMFSPAGAFKLYFGWGNIVISSIE